jgi:Tfp pilus assembly protein PilV
MRESGSSIVEVVIMMLIISMSIIGIYSMVNNGQRLAILTDDRLTAINMAKE